MLARTIERLQKFVGRVCSVVSVAMNRSFDESIAREHFVIRVQEISPDGIWGSHPYNPDLVSFFALPHVISIHEELELNPDNPEHQRMIQEYEERTGKKIQSDLRGAPKQEELKSEPSQETQEGQAIFVDIEGLEKLAAQTKRTFDAYDLTK
jgi:hypothetical protein